MNLDKKGTVEVLERGERNSHLDATVEAEGDEVRVYRCGWGWYVRRGKSGARSRYLDQAFVDVLGRLDSKALLRLVETLDQELTAERNRTGATAYRDLELHLRDDRDPAARLLPQ